MTYIILRDTFGAGLDTIPNIGLSVETYIQDAIRNRENIKKRGEYELYLKLKEKFEKVEK